MSKERGRGEKRGRGGGAPAEAGDDSDYFAYDSDVRDITIEYCRDTKHVRCADGGGGSGWQVTAAGIVYPAAAAAAPPRWVSSASLDGLPTVLIDHVLSFLDDAFSSLSWFRHLMQIPATRRHLQAKCGTDVELLQYMRRSPACRLPISQGLPPMVQLRGLFRAVTCARFHLCDVCSKRCESSINVHLGTLTHHDCFKSVLASRVEIAATTDVGHADAFVPGKYLERAAAPSTVKDPSKRTAPPLQIFRKIYAWMPQQMRDQWNPLWTLEGVIANKTRNSPAAFDAAIAEAAAAGVAFYQRMHAAVGTVASVVTPHPEVQAFHDALDRTQRLTYVAQAPRREEARQKRRRILDDVAVQTMGPGATRQDLWHRCVRACVRVCVRHVLRGTCVLNAACFALYAACRLSMYHGAMGEGAWVGYTNWVEDAKIRVRSMMYCINDWDRNDVVTVRPTNAGMRILLEKALKHIRWWALRVAMGELQQAGPATVRLHAFDFTWDRRTVNDRNPGFSAACKQALRRSFADGPADGLLGLPGGDGGFGPDMLIQAMRAYALPILAACKRTQDEQAALAARRRSNPRAASLEFETSDSESSGSELSDMSM